MPIIRPAGCASELPGPVDVRLLTALQVLQVQVLREGSLARDPMPIIRPAALLSSPALDVRLLTALQVLQGAPPLRPFPCERTRTPQG